MSISTPISPFRENLVRKKQKKLDTDAQRKRLNDEMEAAIKKFFTRKIEAIKASYGPIQTPEQDKAFKEKVRSFMQHMGDKGIFLPGVSKSMLKSNDSGQTKGGSTGPAQTQMKGSSSAPAPSGVGAMVLAGAGVGGPW